MDKPGVEVILSNDTHPPEEIDLLGCRSTDTTASEEWGYKFKVTPLYTGSNKMNIINSLNEKQQAAWQKYTAKQMKNFSKEVDE